MSTLEHEIIEKFHQLDIDAQKRVRRLIVQELDVIEASDTSAFDYDAWFRDMGALREELQTSGVVFGAVDAIGVLRDLRDGEDE
ncbi:hypothetical protein [Candidatus Viridilinea mediisalina]|uniref:Uncharacterized protein n=1 Tax=Candidatus Viridilinea mediisalina TaxID=2024553 RepID=A0A2A6RM44_9CHLR|nr:hypothetical protein [Candidatus Viridilinea mediisalina]PDW03976.1 hypothetical protein CJ255_05795 [Candidatus Viridilinea mediisalina]